MSMGVCLETRAPFRDHIFVEPCCRFRLAGAAERHPAKPLSSRSLATWQALSPLHPYNGQRARRDEDSGYTEGTSLLVPWSREWALHVLAQ
jgi:hypothetical protein